jgi:hypothetical protein
MADLGDFVGTWHAERGAPYSTHTFTWTASDDGLRGEWIIEAGPPPAGEHTWLSNPKPMRHQMPVGVPILDKERLLFGSEGSPFLAEFRLVGENEAVVGAAIDKLPPEFTGPEFLQSAEGHRVRLRKQSEPAV